MAGSNCLSFRLALLLSFSAAAANAAPHWTVQYFYDQDRTTLDLLDLSFSSAQHGIAVGNIQDVPERGHRPRPVALVTTDGGEHWTLVPLADHPRSLFVRNDSLAWIVGENAIWSTEDGGQKWKKTGEQIKPDKKLGQAIQGGLILKLWFLDANRGFAVGLEKTAVETSNAGKTWTPIAEAVKVLGNPAYTAYSHIVFSVDGHYGVIAGSSVPPRPEDRESAPPWVDPLHAMKRPQVANPTALLQTIDGGGTWTAQTAPLLGFLSSVSVGITQALLTFRFDDSSDVPSDVYHMDLAKHTQTEAFREKNRVVCDTRIFEGSHSFLAAVEPAGRLASSPVPGKVKILSSADLNYWNEMPVSYRATAHDVVLAGPDSTHVWAATDTGMILKLTQ